MGKTRLEFVVEGDRYRLTIYESAPGVFTLDMTGSEEDGYGGGEVSVPVDELIQGLQHLKATSSTAG